MYLGTYQINEYLPIPAATHRFSSGNVYQPTALTYSIYKAGSTTGLYEGVDMTPASPFDSVVGLYYARVQLTAGAGFVVDTDYVVVVSATVDGVTAIDVHTFNLRVLGTAQTGDSFARIGAAGASLTALGDTRLANLDAAISTRGTGTSTLTQTQVTGGAYDVTDASCLIHLAAAQKVDVDTIKTNPVVNAGTLTFPATATLASTTNITAASGIVVSTNNDKAGYSLLATGADLILKSSTFIQAIVAAINELATYGLTALNALLVTTGIKAATIPSAIVGGYAAGQDPVTLMNAAPPDVNSKTITDGAVKSTTFTSGSIDAAALATDTIGSSEFAQAAADKVWLTAARALTSAASFQVKKNTQLTAFPFVMTDTVNHAPMSSASVTASRSIDGGAFNACSNAVVELVNGWYKITLSAADLNGTTIALRFIAAGADDLNLTIVTQA